MRCGIETPGNPGSLTDRGCNTQSVLLRKHEGLEVVKDDWFFDLVEVLKSQRLQRAV